MYFSPEMCQEEKYNEKCDVWALGCLIYEMSALKPPFNATNQLALAKRICEQEVAPLPVEAGYSKDLQFIISQMLRKDPEKSMHLLFCFHMIGHPFSLLPFDRFISVGIII